MLSRFLSWIVPDAALHHPNRDETRDLIRAKVTMAYERLYEQGDRSLATMFALGRRLPPRFP